MPTQEQRTAQTTAALRRAARSLFARRGFDAVSVDEIAAAAGVTRGALYHHFAGKEVLFEQVFDEVEGELAAHTAPAALRASSPEAQLREGCLAFIERASSRAYRRIALIDGPVVLGATRYREIDAAHFLGAIEVVVSAMRPDRGEAETTLVARVLLAALCELALTAVEPQADREAIAAVIDDLVRAVGR